MINTPTFTLQIPKGATFDVTLTWKNADRTPKNLTGYTAKLQVRESIGSTLLLEMSTSNGKIILGGAAGTIQLLLSAAETAALTWDEGIYDLFITGPSGTRKLLKGTVTAADSVTT